MKKNNIMLKTGKKKGLFSIPFLFCMFTLFSCSPDDTTYFPPVGPGTEGQVNVRVTINTPSEKLPQAYSARSDNETLISEINILVLENGEYKYNVIGTNIANNTETITFTALITTTQNPVKLLLIGNANDALSDFRPALGDSEEEIKRGITQEFTPNGIAQHFPMYGEFNLPYINAENPPTNITVKMLRAVARVDVIKDENVSNFTMETVQIFRANNRIQIIPDQINDINNPTVLTPSIPQQATITSNTIPMQVTNNASIAQLYLPEANAPAENNRLLGASCIVVGGLFEGNRYYYRADFNPNNDHSFGQVLRNHRYTIIIKRVSAPGWSTPEEAAHNTSTGIVAEIKNWDENTTEMYFDGNSHFGVSSRHIQLKYRKESVNYIDINTDLNNYTLQWANDSGEALPGSIPSSSIMNSNFKIEVIEGGNRIKVESVNDNLNNEELKDYFVINAGRWNVHITIKQESHLKYQHTYVSVMSVDEIGNLGINAASGIGGASANALRGILNVNFAPQGTVKVGGLNYTRVTTSNVANNSIEVSQSRLSTMDVIIMTYANNPSQTMVNWLMTWLDANPHRVLIISTDSPSTNSQLLSAVSDGESWNYSGINQGTFDLKVSSDPNDYITKKGPFGEIPSGLSFGSIDAVFSKAHNYADDVQPLLLHSVDNGMILGVNKKRRIIYIGESQIWEARAGDFVNDTSGDMTSSHAKLFGNIWAWIVEEIVLPGKTVK